MIWVIVALLLLIGIAGLVVVIGLLLPKRHVATRSVELRQPQAAVWQVISDIAGSPSWRPDIQAVEPLPDRGGNAVWREIDAKGQGMPFETVEIVAPRRLVRRIADPNLPFGGTWTIEVEQHQPNAVRVTVTEHGEVYNPVFRFVSRFIMGHTSTIDRYLTALAQRFGENARPH